MKSLIYTFTLSTLLFASICVAQEKQEMKCYVKNVTGVDSIYLINAHKKNVSKLPDMLMGRTFDKGKRKALVISKVVECVKETDTFEDVVARQLDRLTLR